MAWDYAAMKHTVVDWLHPVLKKVKQTNLSQSKEIGCIAEHVRYRKINAYSNKINTMAAEPESSLLLTSQLANGHQSYSACEKKCYWRQNKPCLVRTLKSKRKNRQICCGKKK
jgi:hypothetical protein